MAAPKALLNSSRNAKGPGRENEPQLTDFTRKVAGDEMVLGMAEPTGNIWMAEFKP